MRKKGCRNEESGRLDVVLVKFGVKAYIYFLQ